MKTVMHWKNFAICVTVAMAIAGAWILVSNMLGIPDILKGGGSALTAYVAMWYAMSVWPTYHFE